LNYAKLLGILLIAAKKENKMTKSGEFIFNQPGCSVQPMSVNCSTTEGILTCKAIKKALGIPFDFSKFEILCEVHDVVRFRIEGPILRSDLERVIKAIEERNQDDRKSSSDS
jgi:hypothetical protein